MHCLYCDRPLALIKRLTGDGEFCSKECRKNYQREHNELALARLLESQAPKTGGKAEPAKPKSPVAAPVSQTRATKPPQRPPDPAGFFKEYPNKASSESDTRSYTGNPRFTGPPPAQQKSQSDFEPKERSGQPRAARFQWETIDPKVFGDKLQSTGSLGFNLSPALPGAGPGAPARCQPGGAGIVTQQQPDARNYSGASRQDVAPQFRLRAISTPFPAAGFFATAGEAGLRSAKFIAESAVAPLVSGAVRRLDAGPRWKELGSVLPDREAGKIVFVLGSFLRRPVRTASHDGLPEIFEIPLRPVSFPPISSRMACLEERMHRTDRIGFSPP